MTSREHAVALLVGQIKRAFVESEELGPYGAEALVDERYKEQADTSPWAPMRINKNG